MMISRTMRWALVLVACWFLAGLGALVARGMGVGLPWWLVVHLLVVGVMSTALMALSTHFTQALSRAPGQGGLGLRLALLQVGLLLLLAGNPSGGWNPWCDAGASAIIVALGWQVVALARLRRAGLGGSFAHLSTYYLVGAGCAVVGIVLAILAGRGVGESDHLIAAHSRLMILGFGALGVWGTAVTLIPTVAGTPAPPVSAARHTRIVAGATMLLGVVAALVIAGHPVPSGGVLIALAGAGIWALEPTILPAIRSGRARAVGLSLGCLWLAVAVAFDGALLIGGTHPREATIRVLPILLGAGFGQLMATAMSHLAPVLLGRRPTEGVNLWAGLVVFNLGGVYALLGQQALAVALVLSGMVWAVASTAVGLRRTLSGSGFAWALVGLCLGGILTTGAHLLTPADPGIPTDAGTIIDIRIDDMAFIPNAITIDAGRSVNLRIANNSTLTHDIVIAGTRSPRIQPGDTTVVPLPPLTDDTLAWCTIAGHRAHGMTLMIQVRGAAATSTAQVTTAPHGEGVTRR